MSRPYRPREPNRLRKQKFSAKSIFHRNREINTRKISPCDLRDLTSGCKYNFSSIIPGYFLNKKRHMVFLNRSERSCVPASFSHPTQPFAPADLSLWHKNKNHLTHRLHYDRIPPRWSSIGDKKVSIVGISGV